MEDNKASTSESEAMLRAALVDAASFEAELQVAARDNRASWIYQNNLMIINVVRKAMPWLRGTQEILPEKMISSVLYPGGDNDVRSAHQRLAYARAAVANGRVDTHPFLNMKVSDYLVIETLEMMETNDLTREARRQLDACYDYQVRAFRNGHAQQVVRDTLTRKAEEYNSVVMRLSNHFRDLERVRVGDFEPLSVCDRVAYGKCDGLAKDIAAIRRATKTPPASSTTQSWVLERWRFYNEHPEALGGDQRRKRVYVRDVWDVERERARAKHAIATVQDFRRILRTAEQAELRRG